MAPIPGFAITVGATSRTGSLTLTPMDDTVEKSGYAITIANSHAAANALAARWDRLRMCWVTITSMNEMR